MELKAIYELFNASFVEIKYQPIIFMSISSSNSERSTYTASRINIPIKMYCILMGMLIVNMQIP